MKLKRAILTNFCQHRYIETEFPPGLTLIIGRNGSGKSNLIKSIHGAVTGDFSRNDGVKTDNINQLAEVTAPSKVRIIAEHAQTTIDITRSLRPVSTRLCITADGKEDVIGKAQDATDAIAGILGVSPRMLSDYVFVDQWSIFDFLSMIPSERAKAFQRLFRTERAEFLWKLIGEHIDKLVIPTPGIDRDIVLARINENQVKYESLSDRCEKLRIQLLSKEVEEDGRTIKAYKYKQTLEREIAGLESKCITLSTQVNNSNNQSRRITTTKENLEHNIERTTGRYKNAINQLSVWEKYRYVEQNRQLLISVLKELDDEFDALVQPIKPEMYIAPRESNSQWWNYYDSLASRVSAASYFSVLVDRDIDHCPTCGTPHADYAAHRELYLINIENDKKLLDEYSFAITASETYVEMQENYTRCVLSINKRREQVNNQLVLIADIQKPDESVEELENTISTFTRLQQDLASLLTEYNNVEIERSMLRGVRQQLDEDINTRKSKLAGLAITEEQFKEAERRYTLNSQLTRDKDIIEANLAVLIEVLRDDRDSIKRLEQVELEVAKYRDWSTYCLDMRHILHRENLPRIVAHNYLEVMQEEINSLLIRFDSSFTVITDDVLSFTAIFNDGRKVPAARLSGGEKVLLALAFRVAVNDIFAKDLGLLVLDEPTAGLDDGNISCLRIAIERLKELSASRGLQVIMITHERELKQLFDHVIEI